MSILSFFRPAKSHYADDKAVDDFARVTEQSRILSEELRTDELARLIGKNDPTPPDVEQIGKLLSNP